MWSEKTMLITDCFTTFQGEGAFTGSPATFLRLYGCNRDCAFCDEKQEEQNKQEKGIEEVYKIIKKGYEQLPPNNKLLIITGGEPFLQHDEVTSLIKLIKNSLKMRIHIETNGTVHKIIPADRVTISPKDENKLKETVTFFAKKYPYPTDFKFLLTLENMDRLIHQINNLSLLKHVYLQPEYSQAEQIIDRLIKIYPQIHKQITISIQTHKYLNQK